MPNWCTNTITITGDKKRIATLSRVIDTLIKKTSPPEDTKEVPGLFQTLIGRNPQVTKEKYEDGGWYSANTDWYGCKWDIDVYEGMFDITDDTISFSCDTAWSPPVNFLENLCRMYDTSATITYFEPGCDFAGKMEFNPTGTSLQEDYNYTEGLYYLDEELFWSEIEYNFEYDMENEVKPEDIANRYPFLNDEEKKEVRRIYEEYLQENTKETKVEENE